MTFQSVPLAQIARVKYGKALSASSRSGGATPVMGSNGVVGLHDVALTNSPCIVVGRKGSIGKLNFVSEPCWPIDTAYYIDEWREDVIPEYLYFALKIAGLGSQNKAGAVPSLLRPDLEETLIPLAQRDEQRRILARIKDCVGRVQEIDGLRRETLQEASAVLPSVLNEVFAAQASIAPMMTIGEIAIETRYGTSQKCHTQPTGLPILRIPNVAQGAVNFDDLKYCNLIDADAERVRLSTGDLLFVRTNGSRDLVGRCAVFDGEDQEHASYGFASYLIRVRVDQKKVLPRYLAYFLNSTNGRSEIDSRRRTSAGQFNINSENLRSIQFPVPTVAVQERLLDLMEQRELQANQLVTEMKAASAESQGMREAILRKAFSGEL